MTGMLELGDGAAGTGTPAAGGSVLDWRQWVSPEARGAILRFMWLAFLAGVALAVVAAVIYAELSESRDKVFHCAIILAACGFTMPAFATSIRIMLVMFYMNWHAAAAQQGMIADLRQVKEDAKPILESLSAVASALKAMVERYGKDDVVRSITLEAERLLERVVDGKNGILPRFERKIDEVVLALSGPARAPRRGLLETGIPRAGNGNGNGNGNAETLGMAEEGRSHGAMQVHQGQAEGHELPQGRQGEAPPHAVLPEEEAVS